MLTEFSQSLLDWYRNNARQLPWRNHPDPYAVWVSEIMLQQTRVETVIPFYERWMQAFPTLISLAEADQQQVLGLWEGLGYYSRARNMHAAARRMVADFNGQLPTNLKKLQSLPGIGRYTAAAIASMAFGQDEATLDGNIRRVLARVFNLEIPARSPEGERTLWQLAAENMPPGQAGDYNQALMDLASSICLPRSPRCLICPLKTLCQAYALGVQEERPILPARKMTPHYVVTAAIIQQDGLVLLAQRPSNGLLGSLWEFPGGKVEMSESLTDCLKREIEEELNCTISVDEPFGVYQHAYTHFRITLHAFLCRITAGEAQPMEAQQIVWVSPRELAQYPMGKVDRQISVRLQDKGNMLIDCL
ncbi:MAG: A/G-specific adenine glycosylase [Chloroflexi bacterium 44-23]|nr:MAG: A/G-specific adenine glycosylase [Chloroflexi bacterium 44-23]